MCRVFAEVTAELTAIIGVPPIGASEEVEARELVVALLAQPSYATSVVSATDAARKSDMEDEAELGFVRTHGAGLMVRIVRWDARQ